MIEIVAKMPPKAKLPVSPINTLFVFVAETLSVMIQVTSYKLTGKRIFKMSPLHHHFELVGWDERKVTTVFWTLRHLRNQLARKL